MTVTRRTAARLIIYTLMRADVDALAPPRAAAKVYEMMTRSLHYQHDSAL